METTFNEQPAIKGKGGWRPGAGRPKGAKNLLGTPKKAILEYTSPQELKNMVERAKKWAKRDPKMLQWYLEQVFGKAKVTEREGNKTVNNIAYFLDSLEKNGTGQTLAGQILENQPLIPYQGPQPEQDTVQAE